MKIYMKYENLYEILRIWYIIIVLAGFCKIVLLLQSYSTAVHLLK